MFIVATKDGQPFFAHSATPENKQAVIDAVNQTVQAMGITEYEIVEMAENPFPVL